MALVCSFVLTLCRSRTFGGFLDLYRKKSCRGAFVSCRLVLTRFPSRKNFLAIYFLEIARDLFPKSPGIHQCHLE